VTLSVSIRTDHALGDNKLSGTQPILHRRPGLDPGPTSVIVLIRKRRANGAAILGIFHEESARNAIADRIVDVTRFAA